MTAAIGAAFGALADPHRRRAVELLCSKPHSAGELAQALGVSAPTMSKHLRHLRAARLVEERHPEFDARVRIYSLRSERLSLVRDWLAAAETMWVEQLSAFKRHIESDAEA